MPHRTITCPDCGLILRIAREVSGSKLIYDVNEWRLRCIRPQLEGPAWCLVRRDGLSEKPN
jgi:hypothetical protein